MKHTVHTSAAGSAYVRCDVCRQHVVLAVDEHDALRVPPHPMPEPPTNRQPPPFLAGDPCDGGNIELGKVERQ